MGGRGASSGISDKENKYGSQYYTILQSGNIKFVAKNKRTSEPLMETMTKGRIYVTVGGNDLLEITYFDKENKRYKTIGLDHPHKGIQPHTHHGYFHNENDGSVGAAEPTPAEKKIIAKVKKSWYNYRNKR
ncbi:MAG: hypothetical protein HDQ95_01530 [Roseburia sp.]|nr:hypothetical protein [Roseburia sp.]